MRLDGFASNHAGGILGGISSGQDVARSIALKPTSSILIPGRSVNLAGEAVEVRTKGRHDPCVGIRATPIAEAMVALVLMDQALRHRAQCGDVGEMKPNDSREARKGMSKKSNYNVAVVGATGAVGEALLSILAERKFPIGEIVPLASERSAGEQGRIRRQRHLHVRNLADFDFAGIDIAFFSAGGKVSREHAPRAAAAGAVVIDNTSEFRYEEDIPLVVSEVNPHAIAQYTNRGIIANPNCSTMQMLVALAPIHRAVRHRAHQRRDLSIRFRRRPLRHGGTRPSQTAALLNFQDVEPSKFPAADRVQCDSAHRRLPGQRLHQGRNEDGVGDAQDPRATNRSQVNPTCVRVPVFFGHSEAVHIETRAEICARSKPRVLLRTGTGRRGGGRAQAGRLSHAGRAMRPATMRCSSGASARTSRIRAGWTCGSFPTTSARAPRSTRCRSPNCWCAIIFDAHRDGACGNAL